jgi:hypothetical protein
MTKTHPEQRNETRRATDQLTRDSGIFRSPGPRRNNDRTWVGSEQGVSAGFVVTHDLDNSAKFAEILHEVVDETVVVVDHKHAWRSHTSSLP